MAAGVTMLEGRGLTKRFGGLTAVREVNFDVRQGEIVGLIGPNGSGKTTLFNLVAGYYRPDAGSLAFEGRPMTGKPPNEVCRLGIARTFQLSRPFQDMTVEQNLAVGVLYGNSGISDVSEATVEARGLLAFIGLGDVANARTSRLTLAQRKRLEIGRALATRPRLLLLDESMAGLNAVEVAAAVQLLRRLRDEAGLTLVVVEHVLQVIMGLCERVVVLDSGAKIADGPPDAVAADPTVIQAYLGTRAARAIQGARR